MNGVFFCAIVLALAAVTALGQESPFYASSYENIVNGANTASVNNQGGPYAYYPLNDLPNGAHSVASRSGLVDGTYANDGSVNLGAADQYAIDGTAFGLSGNSPSVELPAIPASANAGGAVTVEFWYLPESGGVGSFFPFLCNSGFGFILSASGVAVDSFADNIIVANNVFSAGNYYFVSVAVSAASAGSRTVTLYINGVQINSVSHADFFPDNEYCPVMVLFGNNIYVDEIAVYEYEMSASSVELRYVVGSLRACRCRPCFSASTCTATGAVSFTCGACPSGYSGNGQECVPTSLTGSCALPPAQSNNPSYCVANCADVTTCMLCAMNFDGSQQVAARFACNGHYPSFSPIPSSTPSYTSNAETILYRTRQITNTPGGIEYDYQAGWAAQSSTVYTQSLSNFDGYTNPWGNDAYSWLHSEAFVTDADELWWFEFGVDAHYGGSVYIDGVLSAVTFNDIYDPSYTNPNQILSVNVGMLSAGPHTIDVYWAEQCCNSPSSARISKDNGNTWISYSVDNL